MTGRVRIPTNEKFCSLVSCARPPALLIREFSKLTTSFGQPFGTAKLTSDMGNPLSLSKS